MGVSTDSDRQAGGGWLQRLLPRLWAVLNRRRLEREMDDELAFHLEMEAERLEQQGVEPAEARRLAATRLGSVERTREEVRDERFGGWLETFWQDLRYGVRALLRSPGYTAAALVTLALGIGANTAVFSAVHSVLLAPLPYADGDELVLVRQHAPGLGREDFPLSVPELMDYREGNGTLSGLVEYHSMWFNLLGRGEPLRVQTGVVTAGYFDLLGIEPQLGRSFVAEDETPQAEAVLLLSHEFWQQRFGGDPEVVGEVFEMNDRSHTVVGVLPPLPGYPDANDVYMPTTACPFRFNPEAIADRDRNTLLVIGRLADGVTREQAEADLARVASAMVADHPESYPAEAGFGVRLVPLSGELTRGARPLLLVLLGTVVLVLLAASSNVASLLLARLLSQRQELALRTALGASRLRLARQLITEGLLLSLAGGAVGLLLAVQGVDLLTAAASTLTPRAGEIELGVEVLAFTFGVAVATGLLLGLLAAFHAARQDPARRLSAGGRGAAGSRLGNRLQRLLVVAQVAASVILLLGAGLTVRSLMLLSRVDTGFDGTQVQTARMQLNWVKYGSGEERWQLYSRLLGELERRPWVESAALASEVPMAGEMGWLTWELPERPRPEGTPQNRVAVRWVTPEYFETLAIPLLSGRGFGAGDNREAPPVAVVSREMAGKAWGGEAPLGRMLTLAGNEQPTRVVGVAGDVRHRPAAEVVDELYLPLAQSANLSTTLLVRTAADPALVEREVKAALQGLDPEQPLFRFRSLEELRSQQIASPRLTALLLALFAGLCLAITLAGVAGLLAFRVNRRRREIAVRLALGAERSGVLALVLKEGLLLVGAGLLVGMAGGIALTRFLTGLLYGVEPGDPLTYLVTALLLLGVAAAACMLPAGRATRIDPMAVLKQE